MAGVDVRLIISARASGNPLPDWAGNTFFLDVVAAGVRVFLYEKGYLHAKTIAVDGEICSIGSTNIDIMGIRIAPADRCKTALRPNRMIISSFLGLMILIWS